jgi:chorismate dehydratase
MLKKRIQVSLVSYSNTLPFSYGIHIGDLKTELLVWEDYPSLSSRRVTNEDVDIALVPVGALPQLKKYNIFGRYCIGAVGKVDSVILFSNTEIKKMKSIKLDYQSTTSNKLLQILCKEHWKIAPKFEITSAGYETKIADDEGGLIIGDRAFAAKNKFKFQYDLAEAWMDLTGLPFVFAVWVNISDVDPAILEEINLCFDIGVSKIVDVCKKHHELEFDLLDYLSHKISYPFDAEKRKGLDLFLEKLKNL